jgi:hypothetical protein
MIFNELDMDYSEYGLRNRRVNGESGENERDDSTVKVNPYRLFNLPEPHIGKFTREELKKNMRRLVLITHPDKVTGSEKKFKVVTECYKYLSGILMEEEKLTEDITKKGVLDEKRILREGTDVEIPKTNFKRFSNESGKGFDIKGFNQYFDEVRMDETESRGHGEWLKAVDPEAEEKSKRRISQGQFQEVFEEERQKVLKEKRIVAYKGVQPLLSQSRLGGISLSTGSHYDADEEMGEGVRIGGRGGVDVRRAHEIGVIPIGEDNRVITGTVSKEEAQKFRQEARLIYTEEEKAEYERQKIEENLRQARIRSNIEKRNAAIEMHYQKVNMLLKN